MWPEKHYKAVTLTCEQLWITLTRGLEYPPACIANTIAETSRELTDIRKCCNDISSPTQDVSFTLLIPLVYSSTCWPQLILNGLCNAKCFSFYRATALGLPDDFGPNQFTDLYNACTHISASNSLVGCYPGWAVGWQCIIYFKELQRTFVHTKYTLFSDTIVG